LLYTEQRRYDAAEKYYLMAIDEGYNPAINNLAVIYDRQQKYELAEKF
jgi:TPR repeat protein